MRDMIYIISCLAELRGIDLQTGIFTLRQIKAATDNFCPSNKLGAGGFGNVYKVLLMCHNVNISKQMSKIITVILSFCTNKTHVMQGLLVDGTMIAVKRLSSNSNQGSREFVNEIGIISALNHVNLVKLYGCCSEGDELCLIYEYMENNSLSHALFGEFNILPVK